MKNVCVSLMAKRMTKMILCSFFILHSLHAAPVWDNEFFQAPVRPESFGAGQFSPGEWDWWKGDDYHRIDEKIVRERFWHPDVDYSAFEWHTTRERLDNRNLIMTDTRSCPFDDTLACKRWLATPRTIESLREPRGYTPVELPQTPEELRIQGMFQDKAARRREYLYRYPTPEPRPNIWANHYEFQNCPFETEAECRIWLRKPTVRETVTGLASGVHAGRIADLIALSRAGNAITADMPKAAPLLNRYRALLAASQACCTSGMIHGLRSSGVAQGMIYRIMMDDANFFQFQERCLMITDEEFMMYSEATTTTGLAADVRDGCLCRSREYFESLLMPFPHMWRSTPPFADSGFEWTYADGLGRMTTVSINQDVQNVLDRLQFCP